MKLQHPLGVAYHPIDHILFVADTYNHKIKKIDLNSNTCVTCDVRTSDGNSLNFNEPGGLCVSPQGDKLYVADTNNHSIEVVELETLESKHLKLSFDTATVTDSAKELKYPKTLNVNSAGGKIQLTFQLATEADSKFTEDAPQKWNVVVPESWTVTNDKGSLETEENEIKKLILEVVAPSTESEDQQHLLVTFKLSLCSTTKDVCYPKVFTLAVPIASTSDGEHSIDDNIDVKISESELCFASHD